MTEINPIIKPVYDQLQAVLERLDSMTELGSSKSSKKIPFSEFCKQENIARTTCYNWAERGLIKLEKIGGRQYVLSDSISVTKKYQREPVAA